MPEQTLSPRLRWQCRRGMLEIDLLLNSFLDSGYAALTVKERQDFERFLDYPDQLLIEWLMGRERPMERDLANITDRIRNTAAT